MGICRTMAANRLVGDKYLTQLGCTYVCSCLASTAQHLFGFPTSAATTQVLVLISHVHQVTTHKMVPLAEIWLGVRLNVLKRSVVGAPIDASGSNECTHQGTYIQTIRSILQSRFTILCSPALSLTHMLSKVLPSLLMAISSYFASNFIIRLL